MTLRTFHRRSFLYHWRMNLATAFGVAAAATALAGALLVGDSMRGSLRDLTVRRLGPVDYALVSGRFVREAIVSEMTASAEFTACFSQACPLVLVGGSARHVDSGARVSRITVLGVDDRFWRFHQNRDGPRSFLEERSIVLSQPLARELNAGTGQDVLVFLPTQSNVPSETLLGRRDDPSRSLRLTIREILPATGAGGFALDQTQVQPFNAFIALSTLQRAIDQPNRINTILVSDQTNTAASPSSRSRTLQVLLGRFVCLDDFGLGLGLDDGRSYIALESRSSLIEQPVEQAAFAAAEAIAAAHTDVLTYLANSMVRRPASNAIAGEPTTAPTQPGQSPEIPYSTVSAIRFAAGPPPITLTDGSPASAPQDLQILLNEWAAADLHAQPGDAIDMTYYVSDSLGRLRTESSTFVLSGIIRMTGFAADRGLTPEYEGITNARRLTDWDPPFPIDLRRIRPKDEQYWERHGPTPKAFVSLTAGQQLWTRESDRFGRLTSIRFNAAPNHDLSSTARLLEQELLSRLNPQSMGLSFFPAKDQALAAARGSTDFGMLFLGFSFFLILSAAMLVALLFRLGVERRSPEIGLLLAVGFPAHTVARLLLGQGFLIAGAGGMVGLIGAVSYAWLMLAGLRSWWSSAVNAPFLALYVSPTSLVIGYASSLAVGLLAVAWAIRGLARLPARELLAGATPGAAGIGPVRPPRVAILVALISLLVAGLAIVLSAGFDLVSRVSAFFIVGVSLLVACLGALSTWLRRPAARAILNPGVFAYPRLAVRNVTRHPRRSFLTTGLIASATFVIVAVGANRHEVGPAPSDRNSGTGGFSLLAESTVPVLQDLTGAEGQQALGLSSSSREVLRRATLVPFRLRIGDEASCLNLYQPRCPRILGADQAMIERGGFTFSKTIAETEAEERNPWRLLEREFSDGAVPAIGDANTVLWLLHLGLGRDLVLTDDRGRPTHLRIVATLSGSVLQSELVIPASRFVELFPSSAGHRFILIDAPRCDLQEVRHALERDLDRFGLDVTSTADRLAAYAAVENTYLSAFQTLGGLGLILGTFGLGALLLRNVWERRAELALLRALGFRRSALGFIVLVENAALMVSGLIAGTVSAVLAVAPHVLSSPSAIPWRSLSLTLIAVAITGLLAGAVALIPMLRSPLIPALRSE